MMPGSVAWFLVATFAITWVLWVPGLLWLRSQGRLGVAAGDERLAGIPAWAAATWFLGASAPSLLAIAFTASSGGWAATRELLGSVVDVDVGTGWNLLAWLGPLAAGLLAIAVYSTRRHGAVRFSARRMVLVPVSLVAALPFGPLGEELGWRGYVLPRLLADQGELAAALLVGLAWALWHIPMWWAPMGTSVSGSPVTPAAVGRFVVEVTAVSILMTWLFVNTAGSLWIAVAFHAAWNADAHRFFFEPLDDEAAAAVSRLAAAPIVAAAVAVAIWPGAL